MEDKFDIFGDSNRDHMYKIWQSAKSNELDELTEEEQLYGKLMLEHEEYHNQFEFSDILGEQEVDPETGVNPFLHISLHVIVENQLKSRDPIEAYQFYNSMMKKRVSRHETIHLIAHIFTPIIVHTLQRQAPFDIELYRGLLKKYSSRRPEKIYPAVTKELDSIFH